VSRKKFQHKAKNHRPDRPGLAAPSRVKTKANVPDPPADAAELDDAQSAYMTYYSSMGSFLGLSRQGVTTPAKPPAVNMYKLGKLKEAEPRLVVRKRVPDMVTTLVAWRAWDVSSVDGNAVLCGLGMSENWPAKQKMAANCKQRGLRFSIFGEPDSSKHAAPHDKCLCGIWAFRTLDELLAMLQPYEGVKVVGQVHLWGIIYLTP
jgi:hypothetical protein